MMPQATDEQRNTMLKWFGDAIDEGGPIKLLESHGYELTPNCWLWRKPVPSHTISDIEFACLQFLVNEWDFGGIA